MPLWKINLSTVFFRHSLKRYTLGGEQAGARRHAAGLRKVFSSHEFDK
jgi:hypothetical protein